MFDIATSGELLAEFVAGRLDQRFDETGQFHGPFPSGAPAIFASQAARMGARVAYGGRVGRDGFGALILQRLQADGIDITAVQRDARRPTSTSFVSYRDDGSREFIFNIVHGAAGAHTLEPEHLEHLSQCRYFHVTGSSLASPGAPEIVMRLVNRVKERGGRISFDPNVRPELMTPKVDEALRKILACCDVFLPSEADLEWLAQPGESQQQLVSRLLAELPMSLLVLKRAEKGCQAFSAEQRLELGGLPVSEVDPTGAGDCFGGALIASLARGRSLEQALQLANVAGAHAVTVMGPMEGCSDMATLQRQGVIAGTCS